MPDSNMSKSPFDGEPGTSSAAGGSWGNDAKPQQDVIEQVRIYLTWVPPDHAKAATQAMDNLEEQLEGLQAANAAWGTVAGEATVRVKELEEQLETMREALEFLRDLHDEHDPRCASLFEPPMKCDCELGIILAALDESDSA